MKKYNEADKEIAIEKVYSFEYESTSAEDAIRTTQIEQETSDCPMIARGVVPRPIARTPERREMAPSVLQQSRVD